MAGKAIYLSDNDAKLLRDLIARERQRYGGPTPLRSGEPPLPQAPEVYISSTTETNDPTEITPVEHYIQRIIRNADDDGDEVVDAGFSKEEVYSPGSIIVRDKFGKWLLVGGGNGVQIIRFTIVELQCYACSEDFVDPEFLYQTVATGQVRAWPPGTSLASVPDSFMSTVTFPTTGDQSVRCVSLMDLAGCWLNGPEDELLWRTGWAVYLDAERGLGCEYGEIVDPDYTSEGGVVVPRWEIMSLCPREATCGPAYGT